jgi:hypothetical protein
LNLDGEYPTEVSMLHECVSLAVTAPTSSSKGGFTCIYISTKLHDRSIGVNPAEREAFRSSHDTHCH